MRYYYTILNDSRIIRTFDMSNIFMLKPIKAFVLTQSYIDKDGYKRKVVN